MRKENYTTKDGTVFTPTKKDKAERLIVANPMRKFFLVPSNVNDYHFHGGWHLATRITTLEELSTRHGLNPTLDTLQDLYNAMKFNLENELGRYIIYYVENL